MWKLEYGSNAKWWSAWYVGYTFLDEASRVHSTWISEGGTGEPRKIADNVEVASVSADGRLYMLRRTRTDGDITIDFVSCDRNGGSMRDEFTFAPDSGWRRFAVSPDGKRAIAACPIVSSGNRELLFLFDAANASVTLVDSAYYWETYSHWINNSQFIYFRNRSSGWSGSQLDELVRYDVTSSTATTIATTKAYHDEFDQLAIMDGGRQVIFSTLADVPALSGELKVYDVIGGTQQWSSGPLAPSAPVAVVGMGSGPGFIVSMLKPGESGLDSARIMMSTAAGSPLTNLVTLAPSFVGRLGVSLDNRFVSYTVIPQRPQGDPMYHQGQLFVFDRTQGTTKALGMSSTRSYWF